MRVSLIAAILLTFASAAPAQQPAPPAADGLYFSADRFQADVTFLADDALEGRDTGSRGYDVAAAYVASQFLGLGLQPGGENGGWYQRVSFRSASFSGTPSISLTSARGTRSWDDGGDVSMLPNVLAQHIDISAPLVFVGYGIDMPSRGLDDYRGLDVRGKIVVALAGIPPGMPSEVAAYLNAQKAAMAARRGAIGWIGVYTDQFATVLPWQVAIANASMPSLTWLEPDGRPHEDGVSLPGGLANDPVASALFQGARRSYAQVRAEAARPGVRPRGFPLLGTARIRADSSWRTIESRQIIGILPGGDPALRDEHVVLMGHLDHLGIKRDAAPGTDNIFNGALDNAAGIATMLEAARAFSVARQRPRRSILFMANTGEEAGLLGASHFAHHSTVPLERIVGVVDLDMPILLYDFTDVIAFGADHSTVAATVARAAAEMGVTLSPDPMPEQSFFTRSDHYEFVKVGVPAILLATGFANGGAEHWQRFLDGAYHSVKDDVRQPMRWEQGARYARLNYLIARGLADADGRPLWYRGDFFGDLFAPGAPRAEPLTR